MSCWVAPAVAAEFWGVSVDDVLSRISNGVVPTKTDSGWLFVDVAPAPPTFSVVHAPTYVVVKNAADEASSATESAGGVLVCNTPEAESFGMFTGGDNSAQNSSDEESESEDNAESESSDGEWRDEETADFSRLNWSSVRSRVGQSRRPPGRA